VQEPPLTLRDPRTVPISIPHTNTQHSLEKPVMKKEKFRLSEKKPIYVVEGIQPRLSAA
jgi:hypothetical protein